MVWTSMIAKFSEDLEYKLYQKFKTILTGPLSLDKAILLAVLGHSGQKDKGSNSYIRHPLRVMEKMDSEDDL